MFVRVSRWLFATAVLVSLLVARVSAADTYSARDLAEAARLVSRVHVSKPDLSALPASDAETLSQALKKLDPYTELVPPSRVAQVKEDRMRARGLGGVFAITKAGMPVFIPLPEGPAKAAGLDEAIALTRVGTVEVAGKRIAELEGLVNGQATVTIEGRGLKSDAQRTITVRVGDFAVAGAAVSEVQSVDVIRIDFFIRGETATRVAGAVDRARLKKHPVLIDLRYATGGDLEEAVLALSPFGLGGVGAIVEGNEGTQEKLSYSAQGGASRPSVYLAVSALTASAAEVFASALVAEGRALLIGETTYGKCLSQRFFELPDGAGITVTTGRLIRPSGEPCEETGLVPDVTMDRSVHDIAAVVAKAIASGTQRVCATPARASVLPGAASLGGKVWRGRAGGRQCISPALDAGTAESARKRLKTVANVTVESLFPTTNPAAIPATPKPKPKPLSKLNLTTRSSVAAPRSALSGKSGWYFILSLQPTRGAANVAATTAKSIDPEVPVKVEPVEIEGLMRHQAVVGPFVDRVAARRACLGKQEPLSSSCIDEEIYFQRDADR